MNEAAGIDMSLTEPRPLKLTIADLELLDREWEKDDRYHSTELIDGQIYHTPARYRPRGWIASQLFIALQDDLKRLASPLSCGIRSSIAMPPYDLPLPDFLVTSDLDGIGFIPVESVSLVVEVAESALDFFLGAKTRLYAKHGIPEYWVTDVNARLIRQMWSPKGDTYAERREVSFGDRIAAATIEGLAVETASLN